jgi:hypothetical protein
MSNIMYINVFLIYRSRIFEIAELQKLKQLTDGAGDGEISIWNSALPEKEV